MGFCWQKFYFTHGGNPPPPPTPYLVGGRGGGDFFFFPKGGRVFIGGLKLFFFWGPRRIEFGGKKMGPGPPTFFCGDGFCKSLAFLWGISLFYYSKLGKNPWGDPGKKFFFLKTIFFLREGGVKLAPKPGGRGGPPPKQFKKWLRGGNFRD